MIGQLLLQVALIALNAFFAATEIALLSLNEKKVRSLAEDGDAKAKKMLGIIEDPTKFLSAIQVGITLAGFLGSAFAADNFAERLTGLFVSAFHPSAAYVNTINTVSVIIITLVLSYFTLVLGELVPKRIAMRHKEALANAVCGMITGLTVVLKPIISFLTVSTNFVLRLCGIDPHEKDEPVSEEDIVIMLDAGADEGTLDHDDITYIKNVFKLGDLTAADIMVPRNAAVMLDVNAAEEEIVRVIAEEGFSRMPVYRDSADNVIGVLHTRDYLLKKGCDCFSLEKALLEPIFVPEKIHLDMLFKQMQKEHCHMAIAVDEYGAVAGIVTMEDILEELVGEIWDEQDEAVEPITEVGKDTYRVLTSISVDKFFEFFGLDADEKIESATVNGWISELCETIPTEGYCFAYRHLSFCVTKVGEHVTCEVEVKVNPVDGGKEENDGTL